jgi:hypothetical protein
MHGFTNIPLAEQRQAELWTTASRVHAAKAARAAKAAPADRSPAPTAAASHGQRPARWRRPWTVLSRGPRPGSAPPVAAPDLAGQPARRRDAA